MKKLDYLKAALKHKVFYNKAAVIAAFSIIREVPDAWKKNPYMLRLVRQPWGLQFVNDAGELETIEDAPSDPLVPLFNFKERVLADSTWAENITEEQETSIGNLFFNALAILTSFGKKFPFIYGKFSVGDIETQVAKKLKDTPDSESERSDGAYYVDEYLKFIDSLQYIRGFSQLCTVAATPKVITAPVGLKEFKDKLLKEYGDRLTDPVVLAEFEKKLQEFDAEYLKGDPADKTFVSGKIRDNARKRMFLTIGADPGFTNTLQVVPVTNSLNEGWPQDPKEFTALVNGLRAGSFSRGAETVKGGVSAKNLLRAANNFTVSEDDCGTKIGLEMVYRPDNIALLLGRTVIEKGVNIPIENIEIAKQYMGRPVIVRSPQYCQTHGDSLCKVCAGKRLSQYATGLSIPLTEMSAIILAASMKIMHNSKLNTAQLDMADLFT